MIDVYVVDGLSIPLLDRWHDALPTFGRLRAEWMAGTYRTSGNAPYEPAEMISVLTGAEVDDHGVYSYWLAQPDRLSERSQVTTCADVRAPWMWDRWGNRHHLLCVNIPGTNMPRAFPGTMISYPMEATLGGDLPAGTLRALMREEGQPYHHDVTLIYRGEGYESFLTRAARVERTRASAVEALRRRDRFDLCIVSISIVDRMSHFFWADMEERDRESALFVAYRAADEVLAGYLKQSAGRPTIVFSEMGYGPLSSFVSFNDILVEHGYQVIDDGEIDWARTVAYEAVQGTHGVNICRSGRQPDGHVPPDRFDALRGEVMEMLQAEQNEATGEPLLTSAKPGANDYGPDIVLTPSDERWLPYGDPRWANHLGRHRMTGWHRGESVWYANGVGFLGNGSTIRSVDVTAAIESCLER
jgi:predicted AlkP superfamily phosphohydrolase/phosphomutase